MAPGPARAFRVAPASGRLAALALEKGGSGSPLELMKALGLPVNYVSLGNARILRRNCGPLPQGTLERMVKKDIEPRRSQSLVSPRPGGPTASEQSANTNADGPSVIESDITIIGDLRCLREPGWEIAQEVRVLSAAGYRATLIHLASHDPGAWHLINPEIQETVRQGLATPANPSIAIIKTDLLIIRQPHAILKGLDRDGGTPIPRILAAATRVIADLVTLETTGPVLEAKDRLFRNLFGDVRWTASNATTLARIRELTNSLEYDDEPWPLAIDCVDPNSIRVGRSQYTAGRVSSPDPSEWPNDLSTIQAAYPINSDAQFRVLGLPKLGAMPLADPPSNWDLFRAGELSWQKFLRSLDFFIYYPGENPVDLPITAINWAVAHGIIVMLPPQLEPMVGPGPLYLPPEKVLFEAQRLHEDRALYMATAQRARMRSLVMGQANVLVARLGDLIDRTPTRSTQRQKTKNKRVLFMSSNGVGVGHLTRLLAIARRMPTGIDPIFATMSQAGSIVEQCGYPVEYIPSQVQTHSDNEAWNTWLRKRLDHLLEFYDVSQVIFDGNHAYSGLIKAVAERSDCQLVWVRRGMWRPGQRHEPFIGRQKFFDLILEPEDIASSRDLGATTVHRGRVVTTPPIRCLDQDEMLPRAEAAAQIGIDPKQPAVLVQLGSGTNRDIVSLIDHIVASSSRFPKLQVVVAEWLMSFNSFSYWPSLKRIRGFPLSRYFAAFDFTVTAAGYNSFNEVMSLGLPPIFSPNTHESMDDQAGRATFATENGAGLFWGEGDRESLDPLIDAMMDKNVRQALKANALRISQPNGADDAVHAIVDLIAEVPGP